MTAPQPLVVYLAGCRWGDVPGTDKRIVTALGETGRVLWVDPPFSALTRMRARDAALATGIEEVAPGVVRLQTAVPPGASRRGIRPISDYVRGRAIRAAVRRFGGGVAGVVVASVRERFVDGIAAPRLLYVTDDWVAGATLMGLSSEGIAAQLQRNAARSTAVAAVSPVLAATLERSLGVAVSVLANGCRPAKNVSAPTGADAVVVGQLNDRLDLAVLEAVRADGTPLTLIGPRRERSQEATAGFDRLIASPGVTWLGEVPETRLPELLARSGVGITPYSTSAFNRASFPLKTLEYLASGLPVVSTDLPAVGWLDTDLIDVAATPADFARKVREVLALPSSDAEAQRRWEFATTHSWGARAQQLRALIE